MDNHNDATSPPLAVGGGLPTPGALSIDLAEIKQAHKELDQVVTNLGHHVDDVRTALHERMDQLGAKIEELENVIRTAVTKHHTNLSNFAAQVDLALVRVRADQENLTRALMPAPRRSFVTWFREAVLWPLGQWLLRSRPPS